VSQSPDEDHCGSSDQHIKSKADPNGKSQSPDEDHCGSSYFNVGTKRKWQKSHSPLTRIIVVLPDPVLGVGEEPKGHSPLTRIIVVLPIQIKNFSKFAVESQSPDEDHCGSSLFWQFG